MAYLEALITFIQSELIFALNNFPRVVKDKNKLKQHWMKEMSASKQAILHSFLLENVIWDSLGPWCGLCMPLMCHICIPDPCTCNGQAIDIEYLLKRYHNEKMNTFENDNL